MGNLFLRPFIFLILITLASQTFAQKSGNWAETKLGIRAGLNFNGMSGITQVSANLKPGYSFGFVLNFRSSKKLSSTQEVLFSNKGWSYQRSDGEMQIYSINYIDIPWTINYNIAEGWTIYGGPQLSFLIDATTNLPSSEEKKESFSKELLSTIDIGVVVGTEYVLPSNIFFGLRYTRGIFSAFSSNDSKYNNNNLMLTAGYYFYRKKGNVFD